jgi:hypothetical protein
MQRFFFKGFDHRCLRAVGGDWRLHVRAEGHRHDRRRDGAVGKRQRRRAFGGHAGERRVDRRRMHPGFGLFNRRLDGQLEFRRRRHLTLVLQPTRDFPRAQMNPEIFDLGHRFYFFDFAANAFLPRRVSHS